jgi:moderate conductance mechanosensitive channel
MRRPTITLCVLALVVGMATLVKVQAAVSPAGSSGANAKASVQEIPEHLSREQVRELLSKLSDDQVRALLIRELDKKVADESAPAPGEEMDAVDQLHDMVEMARLRLTGVLDSWPMLAGLPGQVQSQVTAAGTASIWSVVLGLVIMLAAAWSAETLLRRVTGIGAPPPPSASPRRFAERLGTSVMRALMRLLALLVFAVAAFLVMFAAVWNNDAAEPLFSMVLTATVAIRVIAILMDVVLAPDAADIRLVTLDDQAVRKLRLRLLIVAGLLVADFVIIRSLDTFGIDIRVVTLLHLIFGTFVVTAVIVMIWEARHAYAAIIRGGDTGQAAEESGFVSILAGYWHLFAIAAVLVLFALAIGKLGVQGVGSNYAGVKTLVLLMLLPLIDVGLRRLVARIFKPKDETDEGLAGEGSSLFSLAHANAADELSRRAATHEVQAVVLKNLRIVLGFVSALLVLHFWGVQVGAAATSMAGERVGKAFFDIVIVVLLAYAIWSVVKAAVSYHLGADAQRTEVAIPGVDGEAGGAGQTRMQTLLPLFRKIILITLLIMGTLLVLSSLGVNIGPLIAGAGVVGIAIGFGAQTLVRDIVSGIFFLMDDAFRMGEYVSIGDVRGVVEGISIRSLRLRHHNGPLHTIPFGEIKHLTNYSRDYAIMKFELRLPFETDINKVRKIIKTVGQEMQEDPELAPLMIAPLKSQGVNRMEDSALIVRCKFTALPGQQFYVRREAFTRIQKAFEEKGIRFAPKRVIVEAATPALAVAGAAAVETEDLPPAENKLDERG